MDNQVSIKIVRSDGKTFYMNEQSPWKILELDNFGTVDNEINTVDNAIGDGGIISSSRVAQKDRTIVAKSLNTNSNDVIRAEALKFFNPKYMYSVYIKYMGNSRWFEGALHKAEIPTINPRRIMKLTVTFMCPSPWMKSVDDYGKNIAEKKDMAAFPYLCSKTDGTMKGHTASVYKFISSIAFNNDGDVDTYCKAVITASGNVLNPKLLLNESYVRLIDTLVKGDVVIMDFTKNPPTITKNGNNWIGHCDRTSNFDGMLLKLGSTDVSFGADEGMGYLNINIFYNKLYVGI